MLSHKSAMRIHCQLTFGSRFWELGAMNDDDDDDDDDDADDDDDDDDDYEDDDDDEFVCELCLG